MIATRHPRHGDAADVDGDRILGVLLLFLAVTRAHWWRIVPDADDGIVGALAFWLQPDRVAIAWVALAGVLVVALVVRRWRACLVRVSTSAAVGLLAGLAVSLIQSGALEAGRHAASNIVIAGLLLLVTWKLSPRVIEPMTHRDEGGED